MADKPSNWVERPENPLSKPLEEMRKVEDRLVDLNLSECSLDDAKKLLIDYASKTGKIDRVTAMVIRKKGGSVEEIDQWKNRGKMWESAEFQATLKNDFSGLVYLLEEEIEDIEENVGQSVTIPTDMRAVKLRGILTKFGDEL